MKFLAGFSAAYLIAAIYTGLIIFASGAAKPPEAIPMFALGWPGTLAPLFWRDDLWLRNRPPTPKCEAKP